MTTISDLQALVAPTENTGVSFPSASYTSAGRYFLAYSEEMARAASSIDPAALDCAAKILLTAYRSGARVFSCGNGGSAAIANHLACDHLKGVRTATDLAPRVVSLTASIELITAIANDITYEDVFVYQLQSQSEPGDVLIAISSSGRSQNIVRSLTWAREHGIRTIALTGFDGGEASMIAEVAIHVNGTNYGIIEDLHQAIGHSLAQYIRQSRMTENAISSEVF
jgi:phosphoheptose isomerase